MKFKLSNNSSIANGTSAVGYVKTTYTKLVDKLGEPINLNSGDKKVNCEWILLFDDGSVGTIYDWKCNTIPKDNYYWHIGGKGSNIIEKINIALNTE